VRIRLHRLRETIPRAVVSGLIIFGIVAMHHLPGPGSTGPDHAGAGIAAVHDTHHAHDGPAGLGASWAIVTSHVPVTPDSTAHSTAGFVGSPTGGEASAVAEPGGTNNLGHGTDHHLLHLCLAVLTAMVLALGFWLLAVRLDPLRLAPILRRIQLPALRRQPPRRHGFSLLLSVCVIRV
jgi:hypothetical protein